MKILRNVIMLIFILVLSLTAWQWGMRQTPAKAQRLAYTSDATGNNDIYIWWRNDNDSIVRVTDRDTFEDSSSWLPDASAIIYIGPASSSNRTIFLTSDTGQQHQALSVDGISRQEEAVWSPDGHWIYFSGYVEGNWDIYKMRRDGSGLQRLTTDPNRDRQPAISPDGQHVLFVSNRERGYKLYMMENDGQNLRQTHRFPPGTHHQPRLFARWHAS